MRRRMAGRTLLVLFTFALTMIAWLSGTGTAAAGGAAGTAGTDELRLVVHPVENRLSVWRGGRLVKTYPIAMGTEETPSPVGDWIVVDKGMNWGRGFGTRWIGLNVPWGIYGIHGTNRPESIGARASHGCIRMFNRDVEELYRMVKIGTRVSIVGHPLGDPYTEPRMLVRGSIGSDVMLVQNRLRCGGYYRGAVNGRFGPLTEEAVKRFEQAYGLPITGRVTESDYLRLGLME